MKRLSRYTREIVMVLAIKLVLIVVIRLVWFADRPPLDGDAVAAQLAAAPPLSPQQQERKTHD